MTLSKKNPANLERREDRDSAASVENSESNDEIESLVNLLVDLMSDRTSLEESAQRLPSSNNTAEPSGELDNEKNPKIQSEAIAAESPEIEFPLEGDRAINLLEEEQPSLGTSAASVESGIETQIKAESPQIEFPSEANDAINLQEGEKSWLDTSAATLESDVETQTQEELNPVEEPLSLANLPAIATSSSNPLLSADEEGGSDFVGDAKVAVNPDKIDRTEQLLTALSEKPTEKTSFSEGEVEDSVKAFEQLQDLLMGSELSKIRREIAAAAQNLAKIDNQIHDPAELINLLMPIIAELLNQKVAESKEEIARAIVPIIDEVIYERSQQDKKAMSAAIAAVLPTAITKQMRDAPEEIANAIAPEIALAMKEQIRLERDSIINVLAPEMGAAIKAQIELERDAMVDALYPVIGNTISKYMVETIREINEKVQNTLSLQGVRRKIDATIQGVSEAELILKEAMPFAVQAIFLIHKASGLVIAEIQRSDSHRLESEMVAGMLTAIRSFVNDCIVQSGEISELNQIEYGDSKIILEVAGYCYLAVVIKGDPTKEFIQKMRQTVSTIILKHGKPIEFYEGDPDTIPGRILQLLEELMGISSSKQQKAKLPLALLAVSAAILSLILLPWGFYQYRNGIHRRIQEATALALGSAPELSVYRLSVKTDGKTIDLTGRVPNEYLRSRAEEIAKIAAPTLKVNNAIIAVDVPPDPIQTAAEVKRVTSAINQMGNVVISAAYADGKVMVKGTIFKMADAKKIAQSFEKIPGVRSITNTLELQPVAILGRIEFAAASAQLQSVESLKKFIDFKEFLNQNPDKDMMIVGYGDTLEASVANQQLALNRAKAVIKALADRGIDPARLHAKGGTTSFSSKVNSKKGDSLAGCVIIEMIEKAAFSD